MLPLLAATLGQVALGALQTATSGAGAAQKDFESFAKQNPLAKRSKSIDDYYQQALNRYNENPYQSQQYQMGAMEARRATAQGLSAMQNRRAIGGISRLAEKEQSNLQKLGMLAEARRDARFGQYGQAAQLQNQQDKYLYDVNQATPFNRQLAIKQMKSQAANERYNAGLNMMGSAFGNYAMGSMYADQNKMPKTETNPLTSKQTFDSFMSNQPQLDSSLIQKSGVTPVTENFGYGSGSLFGYRPANKSAFNSYFKPNTFTDNMSKWNKARSLGG
jgi:hypothetical protein